MRKGILVHYIQTKSLPPLKSDQYQMILKLNLDLYSCSKYISGANLEYSMTFIYFVASLFFSSKTMLRIRYLAGEAFLETYFQKKSAHSHVELWALLISSLNDSLNYRRSLHQREAQI